MSFCLGQMDVEAGLSRFAYSPPHLQKVLLRTSPIHRRHLICVALEVPQSLGWTSVDIWPVEGGSQGQMPDARWGEADSSEGQAGRALCCWQVSGSFDSEASPALAQLASAPVSLRFQRMEHRLPIPAALGRGAQGTKVTIIFQRVQPVTRFHACSVSVGLQH